MGAVISLDSVVHSLHELQGYTKDMYALLAGFEVHEEYTLHEDQHEPMVIMKMRGELQEMIAYGYMDVFDEQVINHLQEKKGQRVYFLAEIGECLKIMTFYQ